MKKVFWILAVLLALALCQAASADVITSAEGWKYEINRDGYGVLKGYEGEETNLVLPTDIDGITITAIGNGAFEGNTGIKGVVIPDGYTWIGVGAFRNCTRISTVRISGTLQEWATSWGNNGAFAGCVNLFEVEFGEGITSVGPGAFEGCSLLDTVKLPPTVILVGERAFKDCELLDIVEVYGSIGREAFCNCTYMSSLTIYNAEKIEEGAFRNCTSLQKAPLPETLTFIGAEAFRGCSKLKSVTIPDSVTEIGFCAFNNCKQLKELVIGESVRQWGTSWGDSSVFADNPSLASVTIRPGVQMLPAKAFRNCDSLTSVTLPDGMLTIKEGAFEDCDQLAEIVFADSITEIGDKAFFNCRLLAEYTLPAALETIGNQAFKFTAAAEVVIPDKVTSIGTEAFRECPNLTKVVLGECVTTWPTSWGSNAAFAGCPLLAELEIKNGVNSIGNYAFDGCVSLTEVEVPASSTTVGEGAFRNCTMLKQAVVYRGQIGAGAFEGCISLESVSMRKVTDIGNNAFRKCTSLTDAELPRTLLVLGDGCFAETGLTSVVIPDSTTEIGVVVFENCVSLQNAYIGNNIGKWRTSWGSNGAFRGCTALEYVFFADDGTTIGEHCLEGCAAVKAVYIPRSILNIPDSILVKAAQDAVIYGQAGSAAETFAASQNLSFETGEFPFSFDE